MAWNKHKYQGRMAAREPYLSAERPTSRSLRVRGSPRKQGMSEEAAPRPGRSFPDDKCASHPVMEPEPSRRDQSPLEKKAKLNPPLHQKNQEPKRRATKQERKASMPNNSKKQGLFRTEVAATSQLHYPGHEQCGSGGSGVSAYRRPALANPELLHVLDMGALGRSCSGESAVDFQPANDTFNLHRPLVSFRD